MPNYEYSDKMIQKKGEKEKKGPTIETNRPMNMIDWKLDETK